MNEATVLERVADWLTGEDYRFFIHLQEHQRQSPEYASVAQNYESHQIDIGGYKPDILGFTPANRVFAVEVKGDESIRKGFGQAASYQRGVDHAYLAADETAINRIRDIVVGHGIGVFAVGKEVEQTPPSGHNLRDLLYQTRRQLERRFMSTGQTTQRLPNYADPLNNLMPVLAVSAHEAQTADDIDELVDQFSYPYQSASDRMISLARALGLIHETKGGFELTDQGVLAVATLRGENITTVPELKAAKSRQRLQDTHPALAVLLRNRFAAIPEYRTVFELLLAHQSDRISIQELCRQLIDNHPTTFLNLVYTNQSDERDAPRLIEEGRGEVIYTDSDYLASIIHSQFVSNTVSQFRSLGILSEETSPIEPKSDLSPESDYWHPEAFSIQ